MKHKHDLKMIWDDEWVMLQTKSDFDAKPINTSHPAFRKCLRSLNLPNNFLQRTSSVYFLEMYRVPYTMP